MTKKIKNKDYKCSMDSRVKPENDRKVESGRSMVEMLGTLAIIGVLSVGGIAGYTYAMNRYYTNELLAGASARAVIVSSQIASGRELSLSEFDKMKYTAGGTFDGDVMRLSDGFGIKVSKVKKAVCENLIKETEDTDIRIETEIGGGAYCYDDENEFWIRFVSEGISEGEIGLSFPTQNLDEWMARDEYGDCSNGCVSLGASSLYCVCNIEAVTDLCAYEGGSPIIIVDQESGKKLFGCD